jgi:hypothetical protein
MKSGQTARAQTLLDRDACTAGPALAARRALAGEHSGLSLAR